ncbi:MAG: putative endoribonuclease [Nitrososphaeraceae archaeon]|jgi:enamine deaminase RidA (YjgF/YER057c/UK114 family)|nr:putative endoribonuclease [Nitrososphaeraceae archaeon]MDF2768262.1 putative endoribonuclease [Nitrososphaeraceae archaeon]
MIEEKILALGIELPNAPQSAGSYVQVAITGNLVFVSGQIPVEPGSIPMQVKFKGKVGKDMSLEEGQEAARLCTINALAQLKSTLGSLEKIRKFVKVSGFVNCDASFSNHPQIINGASDFIVQLFGEKGRHSRSAIGASSLPLDSAVEIEFIVEI